MLLSSSVLLLLFISSCKKSGDFTTDKEVYKQGEVITVTNKTEKASKYYKWNFGGAEVVGVNPVYTIPNNTPVGSFDITILPVNSMNTTNNWKSTTKSVMIEEAEEAKVIFFLQSPVTGGSNETCTITFEGENKTVSAYASTPSCDNNNNLDAATFDNLPSGTYDFTLSGSSSGGSYFYQGSVELEDGFDCRLINISNY